ncbi:MAG: oligoendopeptidase F, partial [Clostridia bacterium]|nr:oligoendopeptidase F [Clostridia bacterium]
MKGPMVIRERCDIDMKDKWAVEDLYASDELWYADLEKMQAAGAKAAAYAGRLAESAATLLQFFKDKEELMLLTSNLASYCMRKADEDTRVAEYQAMRGKFTSARVALSAAGAFETPEIMAIPDETLEKFYAEEPALKQYKRYMDNLRRRREHVLSPAEEKLLASASEMSGAPTNIFGMFSNADIKFPDAEDSNGVKHPVSSGTYIKCQESEDRVLRKNSYESLYHTLGQFKNTTASLLAAQVKQLKFYSDARRYPDPMTAALDVTNVPTSVYLNLIDTVHKNMDKLHRYVRLRKKLLGLDELHFYDMYTPLVPDFDKEIPADEAKKTIVEGLAPLGEEYLSVLKQGFDSRWIDMYPNVGKRSGAYSSGARIHPYVLMNYSGNLGSQFTLAHEMGHALHSWYSTKTQAPLDAGYVIFVAEVASTCNEALLMEHLLSKATDKRERAYLINEFLEKFRGTLYRQVQFAEFELNIGRMNQEGKSLTAEAMCKEYKRLCQEYFGPDMVVDDEIALEWSRIPHFYMNYYVFQYATGFSAAIA